MTRILFGVALIGLSALNFLACKHEAAPAVVEASAKSVPTEDPYSPPTLELRFRAALAERGLSGPVLKVDSAAFPPILSGIIVGTRDWKVLHDLAGRMGPAYQHGGAVTHGDGANKMAFALNVVPDSAYPADQASRIAAGMADRLAGLADAAKADLAASAPSQ